jgi:hypothetical protein
MILVSTCIARSPSVMANRTVADAKRESCSLNALISGPVGSCR